MPKAFSVRDDRELPLIQDLMARLNPKLLAVQVAMGLHVNGGYTVNWSLVHLDGQRRNDKDMQDEKHLSCESSAPTAGMVPAGDEAMPIF